MSELMNAQNNRRGFHAQLLTTASVAALFLASVETSSADNYLASSDHPSFWIEFGGEADQIGGGGDPYVPFFVQNAGSLTGGSLASSIQKMPVFSYGGEGKLTYEPDGTNWIFSASLRYGRALHHGLEHVQTPGQKYPVVGAFYDAGAMTSETHMIADFQAGKDVGLGMFGNHAHGTISVGLRFAQFSVRSSAFISSAPTLADVHRYKEKSHIDRSAMAIGPSLAWDASVPVIGAPDHGLSLDWGANAAILFGRQKSDFVVKSVKTYDEFGRSYIPVYTTSTSPGGRKKTATIPNVGGFAGISYHLPAAKVSLGYRADMYFGAIDAGFSTRRSSNQSFYGPFLTVGIGIGG